MANIKVESKILSVAVKKAAVSLKDTFVVKTTGTKDETSGKYYCSIGCCDGACQSNIAFLAETDGSVQQFIFGKALGGTIATLAAYSEEDIVLDVSDSVCKVSCGTATVSLGLLGEAVSIDCMNPNTEKNAMLVFEAEQLKSAVSKGGFAFSTSVSGRFEMVKNAIAFDFADGKMRLVSTDGVMGAGAHAIVKQEKGLADIGSRLYSVNGTVLTKIMESATAQMIQMFLFEKQVIVRENNDFYIIVPNASQFPPSVAAGVFANMEKAFTMKVNKKHLASAIDIAMLNGGSADETKKTVLEICDGAVKVSSLKDRNLSVVTAETDGAIRLGVNGTYLKNAISHMGEEVTISGISDVSPVYLSDGTEGFSAMLAPFNLKAEEEKEDSAE